MSFLLLATGIHANEKEQIAGPSDPSQFNSWLASIKAWREQTRSQTHYNDSIYSVPALLWTQTSYIQPQMHPYDLFFYDPVAHEYTVDRYLKDVTTRYGGIDSVLIWPTCMFPVLYWGALQAICLLLGPLLGAQQLGQHIFAVAARHTNMLQTPT